MEKVDVKFGEWFEKGFNLYKENIAILILATVVALLLSVATVGILAGPMFAGVLFITLGLYDKTDPKPEAGSLFKGFEYFLNAFLFVFIWGVAMIIASFILGVIPCVGQLASLFVIYVAQTLLMFGLFLIVDKRMEFWPASMESFNKVKTNFWPFLGLLVVTSIIGSIGVIACGIGVVVTAPIQACILTVAYREVFNQVGKPAGIEGTSLQGANSSGETASME
jgi:uncharacterized membrane protein